MSSVLGGIIEQCRIPIDDDEWSHVVIISDGDETAVHVNGEKAGHMPRRRRRRRRKPKKELNSGTR